MRATSFIAALSAVATASALKIFKPMQTVEEQKSTYEWDITNWSAGCAASSCSYEFNVTAAANTTTYPKRPAWSAYCHGEGEGAPYTLCDLNEKPATDLKVEAKLNPATRTGVNGTTANIQISLMHTDLDSPTTWWNYTAQGEAKYNRAVAPPMTFSVNPSEFFGAA